MGASFRDLVVFTVQKNSALFAKRNGLVRIDPPDKPKSVRMSKDVIELHRFLSNPKGNESFGCHQRQVNTLVNKILAVCGKKPLDLANKPVPWDYHVDPRFSTDEIMEHTGYSMAVVQLPECDYDYNSDFESYSVLFIDEATVVGKSGHSVYELPSYIGCYRPATDAEVVKLLKTMSNAALKQFFDHLVPAHEFIKSQAKK